MLDVNREWQVFTTANSELPHNNIRALLPDNNGGLWIGTGSHIEQERGGLVHRNAEGKWTLFTAPPKRSMEEFHSFIFVESLLADGNGGLWIGTLLGGLVHQSATGERTIFHTHNSGVLDDYIKVLLANKNGGLWVGTNGSGLARLSFSQKRTLASIIKDKAIPMTWAELLFSDFTLTNYVVVTIYMIAGKRLTILLILMDCHSSSKSHS
jgi:ligand-binding sensor domain-containing protein